MPTLALDSNVFIAALSGREQHSAIAQHLIRAIARGDYKALASSVVFGEVLSINSQPHTLDLSGFFALIPYLTTVPADDVVCVKAGQLRADYSKSLRLPDALHLATALFANADIFITNDKKLATVAIEIIPTVLLADWLVGK